MQVPTIDKIVLNMGIGEAINDKKAVGEALDELGLISGQKPPNQPGSQVDRQLQAA